MLSGSVMEKFTRRITNTTADELRFGGYITDKSLNLLHRVRDGKVTTQWTPKRPFYDFPLNVGKTWSSVGVLDTDDRNVNVAFTYKVIRQEQVIVPAGVFDTLRVEGATKYKTVRKTGTTGEGVGTYRYWFSPQAANIVALEFEEANAKGVINKKERVELLSFNRDGKKTADKK